MDDVLVVVVAQAAAELLVVHLGLVLALAPATRDLVRVRELELPAIAGPADDVLARLVSEELQEELPELDGTAPGIASEDGSGDNGVWHNFACQG